MNPDPSAASGTSEDARTVRSSAASEGRPSPAITCGIANPDATVPYEFRHEIARGGMGSILEAQDRKLGRTVAVKIMLSEMKGDEEQSQRFINEAAVLATLEHPNIVPIHDLGRDADGHLFYTMKLVHGRTLQAILKGVRDGEAEAVKSYTLNSLLTVFRKVCDALACAHSHGIIHRDLKPENIMVGEFGEVLVMDWGLAKQTRNAEGGPRKNEASATSRDDSAFPVPRSAFPAADSDETVLVTDGGNGGGRDALRRFLAQKAGGDSGMTLEGEIMGTPQYMSPEQAQGRIAEMDARSDIFSLGGILYAILTLRPPVEGRTLEEVLQKVTSGSITAPSVFGTGTDQGSPTVKGEVLEARKIQPLPHCPRGRVPAALSAVVMKALSLRREDRYQEVATLSTDVEAYQGGFATVAEKAGAWKLFTLFVKRNKAASIGVAAVLLIGGTLGTKALIEGRRAERALAELKKSAPAFAAEADSLLLKGDVPAALTRLDTATQLDPDDARWPGRRGHILDAALRFPEAAAAYTHAAALDPKGPWSTARQTSENIAATRQPDGSYSTGLLRELYAQAIRENRTGDALLLATPLKLAAKDALPLWQAKVDAWLGKNAPRIKLENDGGYTLKLDHLGITDLTPLKGMPITFLEVNNNKVSDLSPLAGMPLRRLNICNTNISDLSPLAGMRLNIIWMANAPVADLSPLRGMPLNEFCAQTETLTNISVLSESPLTTWVRIEGSRVSDLAPLAGKKITYLYLPDIPLKNLSVIRGMPLKELHIRSGGHTAELVDIVMSLTRLEKLTINSSVPDFARLRTHPTLKIIGHDHNKQQFYLAVAEYWRAYDERKAEAQKNALLKLDVRKLADGTKRLQLSDPALTTIPPIDWTNVSLFVCANTSISDLSPLRGVKLRALSFHHTPVASLEPLRGSPVERIAFMDTAITDVSPLLDCPNLETVVLSRTVKNVEELRKHPKLRLLGYTEGSGPDYLPETTAEEFWRIYDAVQKK